jgi:hypothetical protein
LLRGRRESKGNPKMEQEGKGNRRFPFYSPPPLFPFFPSFLSLFSLNPTEGKGTGRRLKASKKASKKLK